MEIDMTREEAIKELRGFIGQLTEGCQEVIKVLVPELRESEDEKVRRTLVEYFGPSAQLDFVRGVPIQKIRDWLEKQKAPENVSATTMAPSCWEVEQKEQKQLKWTDLTWKDIVELEEIINNVHYEFRNGIGQESFGKEVLEKFREYKGDEYLDEIEQKPTEWSEEDKAIVGCIVCCLDGQFVSEAARKQCLEWFNKHRRDFLNAHHKEWSEEDEKIRQTLIRFLSSPNVEVLMLESDEKMFVSWLRSFRPQPHEEIYQAAKQELAIRFINYLDGNRLVGKMCLSNGECEDIDKAFEENDWAKIMRYMEKYSSSWKPSEEQMEALSQIVQQFKPDKELESLYNDLKKLRVKEEPKYYQHFDPDC